MKKILFSLYVCIFAIFPAFSIDWSNDVRIHCDKDTARITHLMQAMAGAPEQPGERVLFAANLLLDTPYEAHTLETPGKELLVVDVCSFDCTTFVENALALAGSSLHRGAIWTDYALRLENIRYRRGTKDDYASRLHYISDWVTDNIYRGNLQDATEETDEAKSMFKSLRYMTLHPELYPALKDSLQYEKMKVLEMGFCNYRIPYLKKESVYKKKVTDTFENGDIIIFLTKDADLDASHIGLLEMRDGVPYVVHASQAEGKVTKMTAPLSDYFKHEGRNVAGYRIVRARDL